MRAVMPAERDSSGRTGSGGALRLEAHVLYGRDEMSQAKIGSHSVLMASSMAAEEEEEEDLFVTEPAVSASEDEEDSDNERKHQKLLEAISAMGGRKRKMLTERTEAGLQVSEFAISAEGVGKKIRLSDLIDPISKYTQLSTVKKQLNKLREKSSVELPLSKEHAEEIQRITSYNSTSEEVGKWAAVVRENRSAEQLVFPLNDEKLKQNTLEGTISGWKARTPLEMEIFSILSKNKPSITKPLLTPMEEASLKAMSLEEAKERRAELQKLRAVQSYYASKAHRAKKIKSKKYHRLLKKVKQKEHLKRFEELRKVDPDAALAELEKLENARIKERMTLKHQNSGKWAKSKAIIAKYDEGARKAIQEQLQRNKELTQKIKVASEDEEEENEKVDEVVPDFVNDAQMSLEGPNPWMTGKLRSDAKDPETQTEEETPVEEKKNEKINEQEEDTEEEEEEETLLGEFEDRRHFRKEQESLDPEPVTSSDNVAVVNAGEVSRFNALFQKMLEQNKIEESGKKKSVALNEPEPMIAEEEEKTEQKRTEEEEGPLLTESLVRKRTMEDFETFGEELMEEGISQQEPPLKKPTEKTSQSTKKKQNRKAKLIDLKNMLPPKAPLVQMPLLPTTVEEEEEKEEEEEEVHNSETKQKMIIREAFAGDDVIRDFLKEKRNEEEASKPKDISLVLPGWGEWGGTNLLVTKKKKRRFTRKAPPGPPRKDRALPNVIINEKRNEAFASHQVKVLPLTFSCHKQFESSIRAPVGNTWNTEMAVRKLTVPRVITKRGHIIEPISEDVFKKHNATEKVAAKPKPKTDYVPKPRVSKKVVWDPKRKTKPDRPEAKGFMNKKKKKY